MFFQFAKHAVSEKNAVSGEWKDFQVWVIFTSVHPKKRKKHSENDELLGFSIFQKHSDFPFQNAFSISTLTNMFKKRGVGLKNPKPNSMLHFLVKQNISGGLKTLFLFILPTKIHFDPTKNSLFKQTERMHYFTYFDHHTYL